MTQIMGTMVEFFDVDWEQHLESMAAAVQRAMLSQLETLSTGLTQLQKSVLLTNEAIVKAMQASLEVRILLPS